MSVVGLKVKNRTGWRTGDLRRFFLAGFRHEGVDPSRYTIIVYPATTRDIRGWATLGEPEIEIGLTADANDRLREIGAVFVHEIGHTLGLVHRDMIAIESIDVPWVEGQVLRRKEKRVSPPRDLQAERYRSIQKKLARHEDELKKELERHGRYVKRKRKTIAKLRKKIRYYEAVFGKRDGDVNVVGIRKVAAQAGGIEDEAKTQ